MALPGKQVDLATVIANGAQIIDVRNPDEFRAGHAKGSVNIPLSRIRGEASRLQRSGKPIIVCCATGTRSGNAKTILEAAGIEVYNGGSWSAVNRLL